MANLNINQFQQVPIRGEQDLQINSSGIISGIVSANQATALAAGEFVKIDSAVTTKGDLPQFVAADDDDTGFICVLIHNVKGDAPVAGAYIEVAHPGGPVVFLKAGDTIAPGAAVQDDESGGVVTLASNKRRGFAIDPGVSGQLLRVALAPDLGS